ncbi:hypothetical protein ACOMHN_061225 [Nucella lapillus]
MEDGGRGGPLHGEGGGGRGEDSAPLVVAAPLQESDGEHMELPVHFQQPSTSQLPRLKKTRPKGRKSEKPVKLSKRRGTNGDEDEKEELYRDEVQGQEGSSYAEEEEGSSIIKNMKWDISRDFSRDRKQSALGGLEPKEEDLLSSFTCDSCHQTFEQATDYMSHICTGDQSPPTLNITQEELLQNGLVGTASAVKDMFDESVVDDSLKYRRIVGSKIIYHCPVCEAVYTDLFQFNLHREEAHPEQDAMKRFSEPCNLGAHKKIKHAEESDDGRPVFECDICAAKFYRACNLSGHRRRKHGDAGDMKQADKPFMCQFCNLRCSSLDNLQEHKAKIHFSMPTGFPNKKNSAGPPGKSQQPATLPPAPPVFDSQQQQSVSEPASMDIQQGPVPPTFPKPITYPTAVPASSDVEELSHHDSFINQSKAAAAAAAAATTNEGKYTNNTSRAFITPGYNLPHKLTFDPSAGAFDSRLSNMAHPSLPSFSLGMHSLTCQLCGAQMPDERTLFQHLEMHSNEKYLHDVFSAQ